VARSSPPWHRIRIEELRLVAAAVDRELDDYTKRETAMQSRATILIGAASVIGALQITNAADWFSFTHLTLSFLAAFLGVLVVFPRRGEILNARTMWNEAYGGANGRELLHHTIRVKLENLEADERSLRRRGTFVRVGFILLVLGLVAAAAGAFVSVAHASHALVPSSTSSTVAH
jgi:hypothetical protein